MLGELTVMLSGGTPSKSNPDYWHGTVPWASAKDMKNYFLADTEDHISDEAVQKATKLVPAGTVLLLTRGMTLLDDVPICLSMRPMTFNQDVKALRSKNGLLQEYLPYLLLGHKADLLDLVDLAGHGTGRLNSDELKNLPVLLPPESEQNKIAQFLGTVDNRLYNLSRQNESIESIAQAIFKSWFVYFDPVRAKAEGREPDGMDAATAALFPDDFRDSLVDPLPIGWERMSLGEISQVGIGKTPPRAQSQWFSESDDDVVWVSIRDMGKSGVYIKSSSEFLTREAIDRFNVRLVPENTVIISFKLTVGRIAITDGQLTTNEAIAHCVLPNDACISTEYLYCALAAFDFTSLASTSSIAEAVNSKTIRALSVTIPKKPLMNAYTSIAQPLFQIMKNNQRTIDTLSQLRDTLLPRLISGKLRVPEAEAMLTGGCREV